MQAQREAHSIEQEVGSEQFSGERYEPHIIVSTRESASSHNQISDVLAENLPAGTLMSSAGNSCSATSMATPW